MTQYRKKTATALWLVLIMKDYYETFLVPYFYFKTLVCKVARGQVFLLKQAKVLCVRQNIGK